MSDEKYIERALPRISLADFDARKPEITAALVDAAERDGFFAVVDHGISVDEIEQMFTLTAQWFALPDDVKARVPFSPMTNVGWEKNAQVRPSTGRPDAKESYQLQFGAAMADDLWLDDEVLPGLDFRRRMRVFMDKAQGVSERLMRCLALGLGFPEQYFVDAHDVSRTDSQTVFRLLHYYSLPNPFASCPSESPLSPSSPNTSSSDVSSSDAAYPASPASVSLTSPALGHSPLPKPSVPVYRAGAHADWDLLTLVFQRTGEDGLEMCPGRESVTEFARGDSWTPVRAVTGEIVCNIGDLLMSWSDDRFKSTIHRVRAPSWPGDCFGDRYSMVFFNQPRRDTIIQGPRRKYPAVTGAEFTASAMKRNFAALRSKLEEQQRV